LIRGGAAYDFLAIPYKLDQGGINVYTGVSGVTVTLYRHVSTDIIPSLKLVRVYYLLLTACGVYLRSKTSVTS
jgi:hypothetical protein